MKIASHVEGTKAAIYVDGIAEGMTQGQLEEAVRKALSPAQDAVGAVDQRGEQAAEAGRGSAVAVK